jgi:hypothetical protein
MNFTPPKNLTTAFPVFNYEVLKAFIMQYNIPLEFPSTTPYPKRVNFCNHRFSLCRQFGDALQEGIK